jgi:membrane protease YdiL (CAAX protease family)
MEAEAKEPTYLTFPDYKWSARDAWKCVGMLLVFEFFLAIVITVITSRLPAFQLWLGGGIGHFSLHIFYSAVYILTAAYFARTESWNTFFEGFGLNRKPSDYVWFGVVAAVVLRLITHFILIKGWMKGYTIYDINAFRHTFGSERYFYLAPLLLAAFFEEPVMRGFLYKAFRGSYSIATSMALIVACTTLGHWQQYSHSALAAISISSITIVQCYLREKSNSLWDCILCHLTVNASSFFISGILR